MYTEVDVERDIANIPHCWDDHPIDHDVRKIRDMWNQERMETVKDCFPIE